MSRYSIALFVVILLIFSIGLLMVFNTTSAEVLNRGLEQSTKLGLFKQIGYGIFAFTVSSFLWFFGYEKVIKASPILLAIGTFFLILVFIPGIGQQINGAHRWIRVFGVSFQPSEFVKYIIPIYYIHEIVSRKRVMRLKLFFTVMLKTAVPLGLILIEPDNGTVAIVLMAMVALFILTRIRWVYWAAPLCVLLVCGGVAASQMKHVPDRIRIYLNPELDLQGKGHQPYQAKIAAGSGGVFGKGLGESLQKLDYLPEARSDYIAAIYAEEFGFIGIVSLICLYMLFGYLGFCISHNSHDLLGFYLAGIFTFLICFQTFLNLGVVSGLLPSKGTNLPFFSQGGSSLFANFMVICLILNVSYRTGKKYVEHREA